MKMATTGERQMGEALRGLNAAVSLWYTRGTHSFDAALRQAPEHATARLCRAHALKTLGRTAEAARDLSTALALDSLPECLRSSTTQELDVLHAAVFREQLQRESRRAGGWSRGLEKRVRAEVAEMIRGTRVEYRYV